MKYLLGATKYYESVFGDFATNKRRWNKWIIKNI